MRSGQSECGVRYAVKRSGSAVAYCSLSIRSGTRFEGDAPSGIAHFVEHTLFKGTARRSAARINSYLDRLGGELNAFTTKEEIVLHATVLKEDLPKAVGLLLELATMPTFPDREIEKEKGVVIEEIKSYKDSPADDVYDRFEELLFEGHALGRPILGTCASVRKISGDALRRFAAERFRSDRMALCVVADLDEARMERMVLRTMERYPFAASAGEELLTRPTPQLFARTIDKRNHEVNAVIGGVAPSLYEERERITTVLLCNILGGPASNSLLNNILREKNGWVYGVECSYTQYRDSGVLAISLGCDKARLERCLDAVGSVVRRLQREPLSETRLRAAQKQLIGQLAIGSDNGETQCLAMGKSLLAFGRISSFEEDRAKIEAVTAADLQSAACTLLDDARLSRLIFL